jgi:uncharacterized coiled-coil protein SlyX
MKKFICLLSAAALLSVSGISQTNLIQNTGPIGIGTTTPSTGTYLHVNRNASGNYNPLMTLQDGLAGGFTQFALKSTGRTFHIGVGNTGTGFGLSDKFFVWDQNATSPRLVIDANGSVGIGTTNTGSAYKLYVEGVIRARSLKVDQSVWPDYVFSTNYKLMSLEEVEAFIAKNNHLPDVPSAKEVESEGADVSTTQALLLKKIEELTLYIIEQNKKADQLQKQVNALKQQLENR